MQSLLALAALALPLTVAFEGPQTPPTSKERPTPLDNNCEDVGVEWVDPHVAAAGAAVCTGDTFELTIGYNGIGVGVVFEAQGCPSYLIVEPGHWDAVQKNGYYITGSSFRHGIKSYYECDTFGFNSCIPDTDKPDEDMPSYGVDSYRARACPN